MIGHPESCAGEHGVGSLVGRTGDPTDHGQSAATPARPPQGVSRRPQTTAKHSCPWGRQAAMPRRSSHGTDPGRAPSNQPRRARRRPRCAGSGRLPLACVPTRRRHGPSVRGPLRANRDPGHTRPSHLQLGHIVTVSAGQRPHEACTAGRRRTCWCRTRRRSSASSRGALPHAVSGRTPSVVTPGGRLPLPHGREPLCSEPVGAPPLPSFSRGGSIRLRSGTVALCSGTLRVVFRNTTPACSRNTTRCLRCASCSAALSFLPRHRGEPSGRASAATTGHSVVL